MNKLKAQLVRFQNGLFVGVYFIRAKWFILPSKILNDNNLTPLSRSNDIGTFNAFIDIMLDDVYQIKKMKSVRTILDVGGHCGLFSIYSKLLYPKAIVHAYEPNLLVYRHLHSNSINYNFTAFNEAVSDVEGHGVMHVEDDMVNSTISRSSSGDITIIPLKQCIERLGGKIDLVKLDCEGGEWEIFKDRESFSMIKNISMEYHLTNGVTDISDVRKVIEGLGFSIKKLVSTGPTWGLLFATNKFE